MCGDEAISSVAAGVKQSNYHTRKVATYAWFQLLSR
jgi:hypothetical protein